MEPVKESPKKRNATNYSPGRSIKIKLVSSKQRQEEVVGDVTEVQSVHDSPSRVSNSPPLQVPRSSQPSSFEGVDKTCTLFFKEISEKFAELQKKLSESEAEVAHITSVKDEEVNKLKKDLEELSLEKCEWIARELDMMEQNYKIKLKLNMEQDTHKETVERLKAEIEELNAQIPLQYKAGFDKAIKQVLSSVSELQKP